MHPLSLFFLSPHIIHPGQYQNRRDCKLNHECDENVINSVTIYTI